MPRKQIGLHLMLTLVLGLLVCCVIVYFSGGMNPPHVAKLVVIRTDHDILSVQTKPIYPIKIIKTYTHREHIFTQGIFWEHGVLYESGGLRSRSTLTKLALNDKNEFVVKQEIQLPKKIFAEDITLINDSIYLLSYQSGQGTIFDKKTLSVSANFTIPGEGWGLTTDNYSLIISNGSDQLIFLNPNDFTIEKVLFVRADKYAVFGLNALQYVDGLIFANVWQTQFIAVIDAATGQVNAWLDGREIVALMRKRSSRINVMNGVAWDPVTQHLLLTGKYWPQLIEASVPDPLR